MFIKSSYNLIKSRFSHRFRNYFWGFFFPFFLGCVGENIVKSTFQFEASLSDTLYFQKSKFSQNEDIFEKNCFKLRFLYFHPIEKENLVTYIEIYLSAYTDSFLKVAHEKFPNSIKKYLLFEKVMEGKFRKLDSKFQIQFFHSRETKLESNELFTLLDEFYSTKNHIQRNEKEIWIFKPRKEETLWKESEKKFSEGNVYTWNYYEFGELMSPHYPFVTYSVNNKDVIHSRLLNLEENIFIKQKQENSEKTFKLYSNREYSIYYLPNQSFLELKLFSNELKTSKSEFTLLKNQFPILVYKKNLKSNGN